MTQDTHKLWHKTHTDYNTRHTQTMTQDTHRLWHKTHTDYDTRHTQTMTQDTHRLWHKTYTDYDTRHTQTMTQDTHRLWHKTHTDWHKTHTDYNTRHTQTITQDTHRLWHKTHTDYDTRHTQTMTQDTHRLWHKTHTDYDTRHTQTMTQDTHRLWHKTHAAEVLRAQCSRSSSPTRQCDCWTWADPCSWPRCDLRPLAGHSSPAPCGPCTSQRWAAGDRADSWEDTSSLWSDPGVCPLWWQVSWGREPVDGVNTRTCHVNTLERCPVPMFLFIKGSRIGQAVICNRSLLARKWES